MTTEEINFLVRNNASNADGICLCVGTECIFFVFEVSDHNKSFWEKKICNLTKKPYNQQW